MAPVDENSSSAVVTADMPRTQVSALLVRHVGLVPVQPMKFEPVPGVCVSVTSVPDGNVVLH